MAPANSIADPFGQAARRRDLEPPRAAQAFIEMLVDYLRTSAADSSLPLGTSDLTGTQVAEEIGLNVTDCDTVGAG